MNSYMKISNAPGISDSWEIYHETLGEETEFISQDVTNFDLVKPTKVTSEGQFLSYDVRHYTKRYHDGRARRSVEDDYVHYSVHIDGLQTLLKLRPNANLLSPGLVVERKGDMTRLARSSTTKNIASTMAI
ncbi:hypothetical protein CEXT_703251 [Caerostris extrusa]|uniref:Peptidase M12B propeptide domain-containing protein n=1 Tax=Caerostris extrusa TaxID=172846 RepID=A0AAV4WG89_CAEEX|nr:hypothetical protein CEXT_703251 [Caerostris extrusa]